MIPLILPRSVKNEKKIVYHSYKTRRAYNMTTQQARYTDKYDNKCNICLDNAQFPMSNGCCSYKFCKSCFHLMPDDIKNTCGGCRQNTVFSTITSTSPILQNRESLLQAQSLLDRTIANENRLSDLQILFERFVARVTYDTHYKNMSYIAIGLVNLVVHFYISIPPLFNLGINLFLTLCFLT